MNIVQVFGLFLVLHDTVVHKDLLKFDRVHHWHLGAALYLLGG